MVLTLPDIRKLLAPYTPSSVKLTAAQVFLQAAAYRLISAEQFTDVQVNARGPSSKEVRALCWPDQQPLPEARRTRPDVAARKEDAKLYTQDVVTWTWEKLCKEPALSLPIEEALRAVNRVTLEAYELANLHVHRMLEDGKSLSSLNQTFFQRCCNAVCYKGGKRYEVTGDSDLDESAKLFDSWRPEAYLPVDVAGLRPMGQVLGQDMATATCNMIKITFYKRFYKYVKEVLDCTTSYARKMCSWVWGLHKNTPTQNIFVLSLRARMPTKTMGNENIHEFVPLMKTFQQLHSGRKYTLVPHKAGFTTSFLTINNNTLRALLVMSGQPKLPSEADFLKEKDVWWRKLFNVKKLETRNRSFGYEVSTDGRSVKVLLRRLKTTFQRAPAAEGCCAASEPLYSRPIIVRSVDPGHRKVFTSTGISLVPGLPSTPVPASSCSAREFYHKAGYISTARKAASWETPEIRRITSDLAPKRYRTVHGCKARMQSIWEYLPELLDHYGARKFKALRLKRHIAAKRQLRAMCMALTAGCAKTDVVVGYGDWSNGKGIKGHPCGPYTKLRKELSKYAIVKDIDEYRTSKTCSQCHNHSLCNMHSEVLCNRKKWKRGVGKRAGDVKDLACQAHQVRHLVKVKVHGVLHCSTSVCKGKTWDRDINAAQNILLLTMLELRGNPRPGCMKRGDER